MTDEELAGAVRHHARMLNDAIISAHERRIKIEVEVDYESRMSMRFPRPIIRVVAMKEV